MSLKLSEFITLSFSIKSKNWSKCVYSLLELEKMQLFAVSRKLLGEKKYLKKVRDS
jgi:hypothetical protein